MSSSKNPLKAAYSKVREAEERHAEKLRAKAARTAAPAERAPAYTKTLQATKDKAAARRKALAQTERASVAAAVRVRKDDGGTLPMGKAPTHAPLTLTHTPTRLHLHTRLVRRCAHPSGPSARSPPVGDPRRASSLSQASPSPLPRRCTSSSPSCRGGRGMPRRAWSRSARRSASTSTRARTPSCTTRSPRASTSRRETLEARDPSSWPREAEPLPRERKIHPEDGSTAGEQRETPPRDAALAARAAPAVRRSSPRPLSASP